MFETGSATDLEDLLSKIDTFIAANGWTVDERNNTTGDFAYNNTGGYDDIYVSHRWDPASKQHMSVHQALGYTGGTDSGNHTDDSGNGYNTTSSHSNTNIDLERHVTDIGDGPFTSYYIFEDDDYMHVVVEPVTDTFRHFGSGLLVKRGTWTGGAYSYGHRVPSGSQVHTAKTGNTLLDGHGNSALHAATLHAEGLTGEDAATKWLLPFGTTANPTLTDTAGEDRARGQGTFRGGPTSRELGQFPGTALAGAVPMYAISAWHLHKTLDRAYLLGEMPDVAALNIRNFTPKEEVVIGGDTWVMFPYTLKTEDTIDERSYFSGIAYKKVTT